MKTSEQTDKLFAAMVGAAGEMPSVGKSSTNPHFKSKYAPLDAVVEAAQPVLSKYGLAVIAGAEPCNDGEVAVAIRVIHQSGQWIESVQISKPRSFTPQDVGSCLTYASRYGYRMVGLVTDDDDDGNSVSVKKPEAAKSATQTKLAPVSDTDDKRQKFKAACMKVEEAHPGHLLGQLEAWGLKGLEDVPEKRMEEFYKMLLVLVQPRKTI